MAYHVDPDKCIGCGLCPSIAGTVFEMTDAGVAQAMSREEPPEAQEAMESCPAAAIDRD